MPSFVQIIIISLHNSIIYSFIIDKPFYLCSPPTDLLSEAGIIKREKDPHFLVNSLGEDFGKHLLINIPRSHPVGPEALHKNTQGKESYSDGKTLPQLNKEGPMVFGEWQWSPVLY